MNNVSAQPDIFQVCVDSAAAAGLEFLLIGGHAVNARGYERTTLDFDFLIPSRDIAAWSRLMEAARYKLITPEIKAFAQFEPKEDEGFGVDLMLVDEATFGKLLAASEWRDYGARRIRVASVLHLIALKLHALCSADRAALGKDYFDILNLVRLNRIDIASAEFQEIMNRYASAAIQRRLQRDLEHPL